MSHRVEQQAAYILHRRAFQESSLILDIFSLQYGRLSLIAKGAMRGKKQSSALLQPFQPLLLGWTGRSSLKTLTMVEAPDLAVTLSSERLYCAYYLNELILKLLPEQEVNSEIFAVYAYALQSLKDGKDLEALLRLFEMGLLTHLGLVPDLACDSDGNVICEKAHYAISSLDGFTTIHLVSPSQTKLSDTSLIEGVNILRLHSGNYDEDSYFSSELAQTNFFRQAKILMRILIDQALGGKEIKSRELFTKIKY